MAKLLKSKNINFYASYYRKPPLTGEEIRKRAFIVIPSGLVAVLILVSGVIYFQILYDNYKLSEVKSYINDPEVVSVYKDVQKSKNKYTTFKSELNYLTNIKDMLEDYPQFTTEDFSKIYAAASGGTVVQSISYDGNSGVVTMVAEAPRMTYAAQTVAALRTTGLFEDVQYAGYESNNSGVYSFEASCLMKGGAQ
ncbi:MAG: hypothetical protein RR219_05520 [Clostridiales bacterium]